MVLPVWDYTHPASEAAHVTAAVPSVQSRAFIRVAHHRPRRADDGRWCLFPRWWQQHLQVVLLGLFNGQGLSSSSSEEGGPRALVRVTPGREYIKLLLCGGRLKGAVLIGDTDLEETCENLLLDQLDLGPLADHLLDPEVDIEDFFD